MDKELVIEELERDLAMLDTYVFELEKENEALFELVHILKSQLNRKSASLQRSAKENIYE